MSLPSPSLTPQRKVAIAVDLSDESAYAVQWAVQHYLRPDDSVILLHVQPTSALYGADWGPPSSEEEKPFDIDSFTSAKANEIAKPLADGNTEFRIHIVKDHDMKERLCLEVERLGLSVVIMGSRGFGTAKRGFTAKEGLLGKKLGSVSDYCVHHCVCPVVVVRFPDGEVGSPSRVGHDGNGGGLFPVPEEEPDASDKQTG
ncbi:universal stress protein PHOS32-like protein [Tanacetum coccineum]|uniref:Universal stress protein PHOS32-like protein n=1 Tax=Tanacetum coccineum TaxID=301880 RepID=A0ABQ5EHG4_9ASTR